MPITCEQLQNIYLGANPKVCVFFPGLSLAMIQFRITGKSRVSAFIAQVGHESAGLTRLTENLNYSVTGLMRTWPNRFDFLKATAMARKPELIANLVYGGRMGNNLNGDGWKYRGRGLIQITGKDNYRRCGQSLRLDLLRYPELLEQPPYAALAACWFWAANGLNALADSGDLKAITQKINGGQNGAADRAELYVRALKVLV